MSFDVQNGVSGAINGVLATQPEPPVVSPEPSILDEEGAI